MWMLSFIPDAFIQLAVNVILLVGIVGSVIATLFKFAIRWMPWIIPYRTILQVVSLIFLVVGVYFKGGIGVEMEWREKVRIAEEKIKLAEKESAETNAKLKVVTEEKTKLAKKQNIVIQEKIVEKEKIINAECKVAPQAVEILNDAAKAPGAKK